VKKIDVNIMKGFDRRRIKLRKIQMKETLWIYCKAPFDLKLVQQTKSPKNLQSGLWD
jgi:hypothetical protein